MYISPNSTIRLYFTSIGLPDMNYENTLYFNSLDTQEAWFLGGGSGNSIVFSNQTFSRISDNKVRVKMGINNLMGCSYMSITNPREKINTYSNEPRHWYCFVTGMQYINENVTEISFEVDVIQTFMFVTQFNRTFVERMHTADDYMCDHYEPENLEIGDEYYCSKQQFYDLSDMSVAILVQDPEYQSQASSSKVINGVYTGVRVIAGLSLSEPLLIWNQIKALVDRGLADSIVAIYQYPSKVLPITNIPYIDNVYFNPQYDRVGVGPGVSSQGIVPRNNKLFCAPYNILLISNNLGDIAEYHFEDWVRPEACNFILRGTAVTQPCIMLFPNNHRHILQDVDEGLTISNFPQCGWNTDAFKAWWAQNSSSVVASLAGNAVSVVGGAVASAVTGNPIPAVVNVISGVTSAVNTLAKINDIKKIPPQSKGQTQTASLNAGMGRVGFTFYQMQIREEYAKSIDDYFTMFGYKVDEFVDMDTTPRLNRPYFTYWKTVGCNVRGAFDETTAQKINKIYDKGIRFWSAGHLGNYSLDNRPPESQRGWRPDRVATVMSLEDVEATKFQDLKGDPNQVDYIPFDMRGENNGI